MPYMNVTEVESALAALAAAHPGTCERIALPHASIEGRAIHALRLGFGPLDARPTVLFIGGQHAREWGSCEILVNLAADLLEAYDAGTGLAYGGQSYSHGEVRRILDEELSGVWADEKAAKEALDNAVNAVGTGKITLSQTVRGGDGGAGHGGIGGQAPLAVLVEAQGWRARASAVRPHLRPTSWRSRRSPTT